MDNTANNDLITKQQAKPTTSLMMLMKQMRPTDNGQQKQQQNGNGMNNFNNNSINSLTNTAAAAAGAAGADGAAGAATATITTAALRRQPTKYPHGLEISVETVRQPTTTFNANNYAILCNSGASSQSSQTSTSPTTSPTTSMYSRTSTLQSATWHEEDDEEHELMVGEDVGKDDKGGLITDKNNKYKTDFETDNNCKISVTNATTTTNEINANKIMQQNTNATTKNDENYYRKYKINTICGNFENFPEQQQQQQQHRYKYPFSGNYYVHAAATAATATQSAKTKKEKLMKKLTNTKQPPILLLEFVKRFCRWKYLRWPFIFVASVIFFFGIITYCIWLHDVSVARTNRIGNQQINDEHLEANDLIGGTYLKEGATTTTIIETTFATTTTTTSTKNEHESTILRAVGVNTRQQERERERARPKAQTLTTLEYMVSKGIIDWPQKPTNLQYKLPIMDGTRTTTTAATNRPTTTQTLVAIAAIVNNAHFTSGHQNSFGVPIEEDAQHHAKYRQQYEQQQTQTTPGSSSSSSTASKTKVSPTLPPVMLQQSKSTASMLTNNNNDNYENDNFAQSAYDTNGCYSTSLQMCQGVLEYDLTYNSMTKMNPIERQAYENLIQHNCSARAAQFICAALQPECRPIHIGALPPCRRICKAIFEACSIYISNSDILSEMFDCHLYPDSNDHYKCEDPTRRGDSCYNKEFECYDGSCIPTQWQCDNIKDCATGEDENNCLVCDHENEFRCHSNEKCVLDTLRCDGKYDCFDGSDEANCDSNESTEIEPETIINEEDATSTTTTDLFTQRSSNNDRVINSRNIFAYASFLSPNQTNQNLYTYITTTSDDDTGAKFKIYDLSNTSLTAAASSSTSMGISNEEITNGVPGGSSGEGPRGFVNFRDSKEIMMTSDTENKLKYSAAAAARANRTATATKYATTSSSSTVRQSISQTTGTTTARPTLPKVTVTTAKTLLLYESVTCAPHQLRCVSGKCITVDQLCDKKIDCPDGADELMCTYKVRTTTAQYNENGNMTTTARNKRRRTTRASATSTRRRAMRN